MAFRSTNARSHSEGQAVGARHTPLCPAGHLPLKGGDRLAATPRLRRVQRIGRRRCFLPISPLEGEMPGRAEGGILAPTSNG
ncbi:lytic murein transglycosylase [Neorhizobium galegae]|nr:lytic murein transglycosylase [Neorhizobium galegae]KAB1116476.1 lytic murein transglycosylase [Neorhizobium galegae]